MARAPPVMTGRSSFRYTHSVTLVLPWPTNCAISSMVTPELALGASLACTSARWQHRRGTATDQVIISRESLLKLAQFVGIMLHIPVAGVMWGNQALPGRSMTGYDP